MFKPRNKKISYLVWACGGSIVQLFCIRQTISGQLRTSGLEHTQKKTDVFKYRIINVLAFISHWTLVTDKTKSKHLNKKLIICMSLYQKAVLLLCEDIMFPVDLLTLNDVVMSSPSQSYLEHTQSTSSGTLWFHLSQTLKVEVEISYILKFVCVVCVF